MSTILRMRNLKRHSVSKVARIVGSVVVVLAVVAGVVGWQLYKKLTNNTVVAYFSETLALYPGDKVQIMGVPVGSDRQDRADRRQDEGDVPLPEQVQGSRQRDCARSSIPHWWTSRVIQLSPAYTGGPVLKNSAVIPIERTQVPVEWDDLRDQINRNLVQLGPTPQQPKGPFGDLIDATADGLAGKGKQINQTLNACRKPLRRSTGPRRHLREWAQPGRCSSTRCIRATSSSCSSTATWRSSPNSFSNDPDVANAMRDLDNMLTTLRRFLDQNASVAGT